MIGVGNSYRSDDAAGLQVARRLRDARELDVRESEGEPVALLDEWDGADAAIVIDAVFSGAPPGTIHRLDASAKPLPAQIAGAPSTHAVGLGQAIELGRTLGRLPRKLIVYGIEGERFTAGEDLSPRVAAAIGQLVERVHQEALQLEEGSPKG